MLYNPEEIKESFKPLIGWRNDEWDTPLPDSLTRSETGRYYQDFHPMLTIKNLKSIIGVEGGFVEWLENKTNASILTSISLFCNQRLKDKAGKRILENRMIWNGAGSLRDMDTVIKDRFVGFQINVIRAKGIRFEITQIGIQSTKAMDKDFYFYHSSSYEPLKKFTLHLEGKSRLQWIPIDISYAPKDGGSYFLGYFNEEGDSFINYMRDWSSRPCTPCNRYDSDSYSMWSQYLEIFPFNIITDPKDGVNLFDIKKIRNRVDRCNHGINLRIQLECNYTGPMIEQRTSFQDLIGLQMGVDLLRELTYNANAAINRHQQNVSYHSNEILYEIDGDSRSNKYTGLAHRRDTALKNLMVDFSALGRVCFPTHNMGASYTVI